jgi:hypothetical protein
MMKRILAVTVLAALPLTANAGFGVTAALGSVENSINTDHFVGQHFYPTFDYKQGPYLLQFAVLDLINTIGQDDEDILLVGANAYMKIGGGPVGPNVAGVQQLGVSLDYRQAGEDITFTTLMLSGRMGAQTAKKMGIGIYVVPEIGINVASEDAREESLELAVGGQVQLSVWMK